MSAAKTLLKIYKIAAPTVKVQKIISSLLYTLNKHRLLDEAAEDIRKYLVCEAVHDNFKDIPGHLQIPEMLTLSEHPKALSLVIELYPYVVNTERYLEITLDHKALSNVFGRARKDDNLRDAKRALKAINKLDLGYKVLQKYRGESLSVFHVIKYEDRESLLKNLKDSGMMSPKILDQLL